jgi:cytochrome c peroxidase
MTDRTVALGNRLFFDPTLSVDSTVSCSSCHNQTAYFSDPGKALSTGMNDSLTVRNSPSLINLAWHTSFFREGGVRTLELSSIVPITHPNEIGRELTELTTALSKDPTYAEAFEKAFNEKQMSDGQLITALAHYMATLVYADSPYDLYLRGEGTLETDAMAGMALFQEHCSGCHSGGHLSDFSFESNGLPTNSDYGRTLITLNPADSGKFKVPALRGVAATAPYMHDGSYATLDSVVRSYNIWHGLALSEEEIDQLTSIGSII